MISITDYTSYAEIRTVIGVDAVELPDVTLGLSVFTSALHRALRSITNSDGDSLITLFNAINPLSMTEFEEHLYYTIKEYATYVVADACCSGLSMFALKSDSDGKASQTRFSSEATFKDVVRNIRERIASLTGELDSLLGGASYEVPSITRITPSVDRVTNA